MKKSIFTILITLCIFILSACFSPWAGDEGYVTFNFCSSARSFVNLENKEFEKFSYEFTFKSHGRNDLKITAPNGSRTIVVPIGIYTVTIKAFDNTGLRAYGSVYFQDDNYSGLAVIEIKAGQNIKVEAEMFSAVEVFNWEEFRIILENDNEDRDIYIFLQNSFPAIGAGINVKGKKHLIADTDVIIDGTTFTNINMFTTTDNPFTMFFIGKEEMTGSITIKGRDNAIGSLLLIDGGVSFLSSNVVLRDNKLISSINNNGGAVTIRKTNLFAFSAFNMLGGTITGNSAVNGGGVYVDDGSYFTMEGGIISGNTAIQRGGGVFINNSNFEMNSGIIYGFSSGSNSNNADINQSPAGHAIYSRSMGLLPPNDIYDTLYINSTVSDNISVTSTGLVTGNWNFQ